MSLVRGGVIVFSDEQGARFWLSGKVLESGFIQAQIRRIGKSWRVDWTESARDRS